MKRKVASEVDNDRITELPIDLISKIISRLTLKQAVATSLISTRWRDLWKLYTGCFDFDGSTQKPSALTLSTKRRDFVDWVNHVLRSHQGTTMERLRIVFDVADSFSVAIDSWVQLALAKRVQSIHLDLSSFEEALEYYSIEYDFPIRPHCGFQSLKTLILKHVQICGDALVSLFDYCTNLEELYVVYAGSTEVFKLSSLSLKRLTLRLCCESFEAMDITISAPNLSSFDWTAFESTNLVLEDVPQLKYVRVSRCWYHVQSHHSQLVKLELDDLLFTTGPENQRYNIPELSNLKHLTMNLFSISDHTFSLIAAYLKAAPLLENFTLEVYEPQNEKLSEDALNMIENHCYKNLKTVEFKDKGVTNEVEFITHLLNRAPLLEKVIFHPCPTEEETEYKLSRAYLEARECAIDLSASLDCHVTVV